MSFSNLEYFEDEKREKDYSKTEIYVLFLHSSLVIYEEVTKSPEKNDLICLMLCVGYDKRSYKEKKKTHFLEIRFLEIGCFWKKKTNVTTVQPSQIGLSQFLY